MIGPRPIDTVGNSQKSGISQGCGYDDSPPPAASSRRKFSRCCLGQPAFEKRAGVHAGRGVALEINLVAGVVVALAVEEVVEGDFVQRGGRGERRDVAADAGVVAVGADDHRHRVPADDALDPALDLAIAGIGRLLVGGNRVDVGRGGGERQLDARPMGRLVEHGEQILDPLRPFGLQHVVERFEPLLRFGRINILRRRDGCRRSPLRRARPQTAQRRPSRPSHRDRASPPR